ncbi:MAG: hypothetical protein ACRDSJ_24705, partial [Rubrobacteraceae bacterium]
LRKAWLALNSITSETLSSEGRVYGGGLHKVEPKELGNVPADAVLAAIPGLHDELLAQGGLTLFTE